MGEVYLEKALEGTASEFFVVQVTLGESDIGENEYEIRCTVDSGGDGLDLVVTNDADPSAENLVEAAP